jgi:N6-adenosine-specific RNA methylase IME4
MINVWPTGCYDVILSDPPWSYSFSRSGSRNLKRKYRGGVMTLEDVCALPIRDIAAKKCVLYLWITAPKLFECGPAVLDAWGFTYKTHRAWDKKRKGMGYWCRGEHELLLIATRGSMSPPAPRNRPGSMIRERRKGAHSKKPDVVRDQILKAHPDARRIELFARDDDYEGRPKARFIPDWKPGWDAWGDELRPVQAHGSIGIEPRNQGIMS